MDFVAINSTGLFFGIGSVVLRQIAVLIYIWSSTTESQNHRITESLNHRITESQKYNFATTVMSHKYCNSSKQIRCLLYNRLAC